MRGWTGTPAGEGAELTSYSWEKRRPSLALRRSMCSARSPVEMGGCSLIPGGAEKKVKTNTPLHTHTDPHTHTDSAMQPEGMCDGKAQNCLVGQ